MGLGSPQGPLAILACLQESGYTLRAFHPLAWPGWDTSPVWRAGNPHMEPLPNAPGQRNARTGGPTLG